MPITTIAKATRYIGKIFNGFSSTNPSSNFFLGVPRKTIPKAFVKHISAKPPMSTRPKIAKRMKRVNRKWFDNRALNNPVYMKNSDTNPLNGGSPQIASEPIKNR